jgi:predicted secreted protein
MSNAIAAFGALVQISTDDIVYNTIAEMRNVRVEVSGESIDVTSFDTAGWRERVISLSDWRWTASGFYIEADTAQTDVFSAITGRTAIYLRVRPEGTGVGLPEFLGQSQITAYNLEGAVDDAFAVDLEGIALAALTLAAQT